MQECPSTWANVFAENRQNLLDQQLSLAKAPTLLWFASMRPVRTMHHRFSHDGAVEGGGGGKALQSRAFTRESAKKNPSPGLSDKILRGDILRINKKQ
jgi:hypothetical protein